DGRDVLGSAPTGTGKTAAYLLPALQHLLDFPRKNRGRRAF
ncbi:ATP-dependent RNA helicase SrmB, partial [Salmonella enterica subsp. enterica serovar Heidelberg str. 622737-14]